MGKVKADGTLTITGEINSGNGCNLFHLAHTEILMKHPGREGKHAASYLGLLLSEKLRQESHFEAWNIYMSAQGMDYQGKVEVRDGQQ